MKMKPYQSMSISAHQDTNHLSIGQKLSIGLVIIGAFIILIYWLSFSSRDASFWLLFSLLSISIGSIWYMSIPSPTKGVWHQSISSRGMIAWVLTLVLTAFYTLLYWFPTYLGLGENGNQNTGLIGLFDPLSIFLKGQTASQWFVYGALYTLVILIFGIKFIYKYRHSRYQISRTLSIIFFQTVFAFLLPEILQNFRYPYYDFKNFWPLNYYFFFDWNVDALLASGNIGIFMFVWGIAGFVMLAPILTYFFGKRWYCSWVCGCGGLAETAGDSFRHLSDKSIGAWKIEKWMIYSILIFAMIMTIAVVASRMYGIRHLFIIDSGTLSAWYGFYIGAIFSGVAGVGFYPILGSRLWCRFGCPMAAYLGLLQRTRIKLPWQKEAQRLSKFRITTNGNLCISCGQCSANCEMGIDVKAYAQKQEDIIRASCVGCGICSDVCPRGVLRLENV